MHLKFSLVRVQIIFVTCMMPLNCWIFILRTVTQWNNWEWRSICWIVELQSWLNWIIKNDHWVSSDTCIITFFMNRRMRKMFLNLINVLISLHKLNSKKICMHQIGIDIENAYLQIVSANFWNGQKAFINKKYKIWN